MTLLCATHGHCFDGLASAVLLTRVLEERRPGLSITYRSCGYGTKQPKPDQPLEGIDELAILDFRYAPLAHLTIYFDHHRTAFSSAAERNAFERQKAHAPDWFVYDPESSSCTKLIERHFSGLGHDLSSLAPLVRWADMIDSASFASAAAASDSSEPILRLASVVEQFGDDSFFEKATRRLLVEPPEVLARSAWIEDKYASIAPERERYQLLVSQRGQLTDNTVVIDLGDANIKSITKFAAYALFPQATYSVILAKLSSGLKISVGHNPWSNQPLRHDIGALCAEYGGGGHPMVGGIALGRDKLDEARAITQRLAAHLRAIQPAEASETT